MVQGVQMSDERHLCFPAENLEPRKKLTKNMVQGVQMLYEQHLCFPTEVLAP